MTELPTAPETPFDDNGDPHTGIYRGHCRDTDLTAAAESIASGTGQRFLRQKQWQWFSAVNTQIACGGTLLDAGYASVVFLWVFDRTTRQMIADEADFLPPFAVEIDNNPGPGGGAKLRGLRRTFTIERESDLLTIDITDGSLRMQLEVDTQATPPATAIAPVDQGETEERGVRLTQKQNCLPVRGRVSVDGRSFRFGGNSVAMLDYTHGLLEREVSRRWSMAGGVLDDGTPIGFNFVQGPGEHDGLENVVWMGDTLQPTSAVAIDFKESRPADPWDLRSDDGAIDMSLYVEGLRDHERNFRIVTSDYIQPMGRWHGRVIDREVHDLFGIAEQHHVKW
jgi:hypothetical protein